MDQHIPISGGNAIDSLDLKLISSTNKPGCIDSNIVSSHNLSVQESPFTKYLKETQSSPIQNFYNDFDNKNHFFMRYNVPVRAVNLKSPSPNAFKQPSDSIEYLQSPVNGNQPKSVQRKL